MRRTDGLPLVALRKLECTYNRAADEYHPHFHFVVNGEAAARALLKRWMDRHPETTNIRGQQVKRCDTSTLRELFKYFTKLLAKTRQRIGDTLRSVSVPAAALDIIFRSMRGRRVYQPVGFRVSAPDDEAEDIGEDATTPAIRRDRATWSWSQAVTDWVDVTTGECLTGYEPSPGFTRLVDSFRPAQLDAIPIRPLDANTSGENTVNVREALTESRARVWAHRPRYEPTTVAALADTMAKLFPISRTRAAELARLERRRSQLTLSLAGGHYDNS